MGLPDCDRDLERGDFDENKIATDEKGCHIDSQQSSPTLTQGSFDTMKNKNGEYLRSGTTWTFDNGRVDTAPVPTSPRWTTKLVKALSWPRKIESEQNSVASTELLKIRKCENPHKIQINFDPFF